MIAATVTDNLVNASTDLIADLGLLGIFVLMLLESACVPIPSEATMLFAGFSVSQGHHGLLAVTAAGVLGNLVGSWVAFFAGRRGRGWMINRRTARFLNRRHLINAERWFEKYGASAVLFARVIPIVRTFISLPAGASQMSFASFTALTVVGCIPWVLALAVLGDALGQHWSDLRGGLQYVDYAVLFGGALALVFIIVRRARAPNM